MSEAVQLYDTTLRDGMQGEGMSLSMEEKLQVVHALDSLGVDLIEAGFLGSNPKDAALFELLEHETLDHAAIAAFGMTRRRDSHGRRRRRPAPDGRVVGARLHARRQDLGAAPREGDQGLARGQPGDDRRLGRLPARAGQARRLRRRALLRRLPRRPRVRAHLPAGRGRRRCRDGRDLRHQRLVAARPDHARPTAAVVGGARTGTCASASTRTTTPAAAWPTRSSRSRPAPARCRAR